ncbi:uncharacterized protein LY89DRAFT_692600 [Mollisia scopiformis]|uniref:Uncharacterized protein n=1 Tax=Mollisia scopiformis TaxID=149040 RepID=A0A132B2X5_MOLSC|nr:uncharacterized protein LY89DRAFT_692600 [Mollisia scopiformis]KUJ06264.1 hypothetical protein LY89DRAFT_692600 [Mollisia scopiformis]
MPPAVPAYDLDGGDQLDPSQFDEAEGDESFQNGAPPSERQQSRPPSKEYVPFLERLQKVPQVRAIPWRPGQELPAEKAEDSPRVQQRGAILLSTRGKVMELKCEHCARGYGRFSLCITMEPWFQGACSSCIFTSKGNKCSLRFQTSGTADGRALRYHTENPDALQSYIRNVNDNPPKPTKKRKRRSAPASTNPSLNALYSSEHQLESPQAESPDLDTILQAEIAREQSSGQPEYAAASVERKTKRQQNTAQHAAPVASGSSSAWTPANLPLNDTQGALPNVSKSRDAAPVPSSRWAAIKEPRSLTPGSSTLPDHVAQSPTGMPLIDTFPKTKQRHIYGVIGGLESGIDHLNAQVVSLKALLGIDADESKSR